MFKIAAALIIAIVAGQAHAVGVAFPKKPTQIQSRAVDLVLKEEKAYSCILEGPDLGFMTDRLDIRVTATNLQDAAELAITPFIVVKPVKGDKGIRIQAEGKTVFVNNVSCKPVQQSI